MFIIILWASIIWLPLIMYFGLRKEANPKNRIILEVTLPLELRYGETVAQLLQKFKKTELIIMLTLVAVAIPSVLIKDIITAVSVWCIWLTFCIILPYIPYVNCNKQLMQLKKEYSSTTYDEDDFYLWGIFYNNPKDKRLFVNYRTGSNSTVNIANLGGKIIAGIIVLMIAIVPFTGVFLTTLDNSPIKLNVTENCIIAENGLTEYTVTLSESDKITLVNELPQGLYRKIGTATETLLKGRFTATEYGNITLCLDQTVPPYILIETQDSNYLFGTRDSITTNQVFVQIQEQAE